MSSSQDAGDRAKLPGTADLRFDICRDVEQVLKIGRDYQNKDGYRGAHYDTVKLLCDTIEYQQERLETKTEVGDRAKLREAYEFAEEFLRDYGTDWKLHNKLCDMLKSALAEPQRNCDRFANEAEARKAFIVWYNTVYGLYGDKWNEVSSCDLKHNVNDILQDYIEWLFSSAEDTKEEPDGSK